MSCVAIIPARGGSKRIPKKNIRPFHGKPIIAYSIEAAKASGLFDAVFVSSEDSAILRVAEQHGARGIEREMKYTFDDVGTQEVAGDALVEIEMLGMAPDYACCIYPCAPLLAPKDLRAAYRECYETPFNYVYADGIFYFGVALRFQTEPDNFNHSLQITNERFIDINTEDDWKRAEAMYAALHKVVA